MNNLKFNTKNLTLQSYGSGIGRIKKFCKEHNIIEPKFEEMQKGFQVTLYKQLISEKTNVGVNVGVKDIYTYIQDNQPVKAKNIAETFQDVTQRTIERWIKQLKDEDKIEFIGAPKTGGYYVK